MMGSIYIRFDGTFPLTIGKPRTFSAEDGGHAEAVSQAIAFLASVALPKSIELDHLLSEKGEKPKKPFGRGRYNVY